MRLAGTLVLLWGSADVHLPCVFALPAPLAPRLPASVGLEEALLEYTPRIMGVAIRASAKQRQTPTNMKTLKQASLCRTIHYLIHMRSAICLEEIAQIRVKYGLIEKL